MITHDFDLRLTREDMINLLNNIPIKRIGEQEIVTIYPPTEQVSKDIPSGCEHSRPTISLKSSESAWDVKVQK